VVWHDLVTPEPEQAMAFYAHVFGWTFDADGPPVIRAGGRRIGGVIDAGPFDRSTETAYWLVSVSAADVDALAADVAAAGGAVLAGPVDGGARGRVAVVRDPLGATFGLVRSATGDGPPPDAVPAMHAWLWHEQVSSRPDAAADFYAAALGLSLRTVEGVGDAPAYRVLEHGDRPVAGVVASPFEGDEAVWIPYVRVEDPAATARRAVAAGGRVLIEPREDLRGATVGLIADPAGAVVAIQRWPLPAIEDAAAGTKGVRP